MRNHLYNLATDRYKGFIPGAIKCFLFILSLFYGLVVRILIFLYCLKPYRLNCKVISVGNITLGGTGKTSLVEMLAVNLRQGGHRVAVLSRGYKRKITSYQLPVTSYENMGDEPYMLSRNLKDVPVIVDRDRIRAAKRAVRDYQLDTVILDDGFQQWRIAKDLDIVTIDATNPWGNLRLIPRGILREPLSALRRADIFILTKVNLKTDNADIKQFLQRINAGAFVFEAIHNPVGFYKLGQPPDNLLNPEEFRNKPVGLVCGIADPESFEKLISNLGINIASSFRFPDHHFYTKEDLDKIAGDAKQKGINIIITTEKDSVRLSAMNYELLTMDYFVLRIRLEVLENEVFFKRIHSLY